MNRDDLTIRSMSRRRWQAALVLGALAPSALPAPAPGQAPATATPAEKPKVAFGSKPDPLADAGQMPKVARPIVREVGDFEDFNGHVEAAQSLEIRPRVGGTLAKVHPGAGAVVEQGTVLFEIDTTPFRAKLEAADAELEVWKARIQVRTAAKVRAEHHLERKLIPQEDFDRARADLGEAEAELRSALAKRDLARLELEYTTIAAPIRGRYAPRELSTGSVVVADTTPLGRIDSVEPTLVFFDIDEKTALKLRRQRADDPKASPIAGRAVQVGLSDEEGFPRPGRVEGTAPQLDPESGTLRCRASVANLDGLLMPGLFARVRLEVGPPARSLLVAESAIGTHEGRRYVRVYDDHATVELRWLKVGVLLDDLRVVKDGLKEGDWVFVSGMTMLEFGTAFDPPNFEPEKVAMPTRASKAP